MIIHSFLQNIHMLIKTLNIFFFLKDFLKLQSFNAYAFYSIPSKKERELISLCKQCITFM